MRDKIEDWWYERSSSTKQNIKKYGLAFVTILVIWASYYITGQDKKVKKEPVEDIRELEIGSDLLEDDIRTKVNEDLEVSRVINDDQDKRIKALELIITETQAHNSDLTTQLAELQTASKEPTKNEDEDDQPLSALEPFPAATTPYTGQQNGYPQASTQQMQAQPLNNDQPVQPLQPVYIGGITSIKGEKYIEKSTEVKKNRTVYLPPGFMDGILLNGIEADTTMDAKGEPEPVIVRIQAPAVLPNSVKANLQGCFVVTSVHGALNKERVEGRLVSLHCINKDGNGVIDQPVKGMLVDKDGKKGLTGIVVSKYGSNIARATAAAAVSGIAGITSTSSQTTSVSPLGTTSVIDPHKAVQAGFSEGFKGGAQELQKFYMELARQTTPVIEVGAAKKCDVVLTEGVTLEIKEI